MSGARVLAIMGSGETAPTMVKVHRSLFVPPGVVLDTPYGFQENADDISAKAVEYFRESVGQALSVASFRSAGAAAEDPVGYETMLASLRSAWYVFAGPGSPSYALRQWQDSLVPSVLEAKLRDGGVVCFASAAALTLGRFTVPVYEIYKVGEEPRWLDGLDLLGSALGMSVAVIPHFNNAEGGNHDTRFCYLGERRLRMLESQLPDGAFVLGVDEHTGLVIDLDAGTASVVGLGCVTVRRDGVVAAVHESGSVVEVASLGSGSGGSVGGGPVATPAREAGPRAAQSPLAERVAELERLAEAEPVRAILELDAELVAWSRDTTQSDELDVARAALRAMVVRLGASVRPVEPFVEALVSVRSSLRAAGHWDDADVVRQALEGLGVEVRDGKEGSSWRLLS